MFELIKEEYSSLRSQIVILKKSRGSHSKYLSFVSTEQGAARLSSVLNSDTAIEVNIRIIRVFSKMREILLTHKDILLKLEQLEKSFTKHNTEIQIIFSALKQSRFCGIETSIASKTAWF